MVVFTSSSSSFFFLAAVCFSPAADAAEYFVSPKIANERSSFCSIFCRTNCANRSSFSFGRAGETDTHTKVGARSVSSPFLPRALAGERRKGTIQGLPRSSIETPGGHTHTTIAFLPSSSSFVLGSRVSDDQGGIHLSRGEEGRGRFRCREGEEWSPEGRLYRKDDPASAG